MLVKGATVSLLVYHWYCLALDAMHSLNNEGARLHSMTLYMPWKNTLLQVFARCHIVISINTDMQDSSGVLNRQGDRFRSSSKWENICWTYHVMCVSIIYAVCWQVHIPLDNLDNINVIHVIIVISGYGPLAIGEIKTMKYCYELSVLHYGYIWTYTRVEIKRWHKNTKISQIRPSEFTCTHSIECNVKSISKQTPKQEQWQTWTICMCATLAYPSERYRHIFKFILMKYFGEENLQPSIASVIQCTVP